jgi:hypothetical protein
MRTTLDLPDETFRQLKAQAALQGLKLKELVTQLIQRGLAAGASENSPGVQSGGSFVAQESRPTYAIPIARLADGSITPHLSNVQLNALLDDEGLGGSLPRLPRTASGEAVES